MSLCHETIVVIRREAEKWPLQNGLLQKFLKGAALQLLSQKFICGIEAFAKQNHFGVFFEEKSWSGSAQSIHFSLRRLILLQRIYQES